MLDAGAPPRAHRAALQPILDNLAAAVGGRHAAMWLRIPVIPGVNDDSTRRWPRPRGSPPARPAVRRVKPAAVPPHRRRQEAAARARRIRSATSRPPSAERMRAARRGRSDAAGLETTDRRMSHERANRDACGRRASTPSRRSRASARLLMTEFYRENLGQVLDPGDARARLPLPLRAARRSGSATGELIVGERGPRPKAVPTYPELTCHSLEDLAILDSRPKTRYAVAARVRASCTSATVIPYWRGPLAARPDVRRAARRVARRLRRGRLHRVHGAARPRPHRARRQDLPQGDARTSRPTSRRALAALDFVARPRGATTSASSCGAMDIACDARDPLRRAPRRARRRSWPARDRRPARRAELERIAEVCRRVPAHAPRDFHEALQCVLVLPPRRDHRAERLGRVQPRPPRPAPAAVLPAAGSPTARSPRPRRASCSSASSSSSTTTRRRPRSGVTAAESGTYTDFANINLGGLLRRRLRRLQRGHAPAARDRRRDAPAAALVERAALAQDAGRAPQARAARDPQGLRLPVAVQRRRGGGGAAAPGQDARGRPRRRVLGLRRGGRLRQGGVHPHRLLQPAEGARAGAARRRRPADRRAARARDRRRRRASAPSTSCSAPSRRSCATSSTSRSRGNQVIERLYATEMPAPFLSVLIDDCIANGTRLQRRRRALQQHLHPGGRHRHDHRRARRDSRLVSAGLLTRTGRAGSPARPRGCRTRRLARRGLRRAASRCAQRLVNRMPKYGNDDDEADDLMVRVFDAAFGCIDGRPTVRGRRLPAGDAADHLPRLLRLGVRRHAGRPPGGHAALGGDLAGAGGGPARPDRGVRARPPRWTTSRPAARCST